MSGNGSVGITQLLKTELSAMEGDLRFIGRRLKPSTPIHELLGIIGVGTSVVLKSIHEFYAEMPAEQLGKLNTGEVLAKIKEALEQAIATNKANLQ